MNQRTPFRALLDGKHYDEPTVFTPEYLLREARRQRRIAESPVPEVCVLDPDGDIVRRLKRAGLAGRDQTWACGPACERSIVLQSLSAVHRPATKPNFRSG